MRPRQPRNLKLPFQSASPEIPTATETETTPQNRISRASHHRDTIAPTPSAQPIQNEPASRTGQNRTLHAAAACCVRHCLLPPAIFGCTSHHISRSLRNRIDHRNSPPHHPSQPHECGVLGETMVIQHGVTGLAPTSAHAVQGFVSRRAALPA
ncbi:hypothetical protein EJ04DRAFT_514519, partial [Polyplosphaeria fusca]